MLALVKAVFLISLVLPGSAPQEAEIDFEPRTTVAQSDAPKSAPADAKPLSAQLVSESEAIAEVQASASPAVVEPVAVAEAENNTEAAANPALFYPPMARASAEDMAEADDMVMALAQASSKSASSISGLPRLLGASVAYAADLPSLPEVVPPAPNLRNVPLSSDPGMRRPDEQTSALPPAPTVSPYVSRDSAAQKQAEINRREQELLALQQQMESRMGELHNLENRLQGMLNDANSTQDGKMGQLIQMYANMKPRVAAQALTTMDESIAVRILTGMKSKESGEILSYMDPRHAARLSEVMSKMTL